MIYRIDVQTAPLARGGEAAVDPFGEAVRHQIQEFGVSVGSITTSRVFLIDADATPVQIDRAARELLADPLVESAQLITAAPSDVARSRIEIHLKAGVMDPVAASTEMALRDMGVAVREVRTGRAYLIEGMVPREELQSIAGKVLANGVIESIHFDCFIPQQFETGRDYQFLLRHVQLTTLTDTQLVKLSREGHLFLSLAEMQSIQIYFRKQNREPTDIELETLAQTWSEHCVHKTLKSAVEVEVRDEDGKVIGNRRYGNLIKETIFDSTMQLMGKMPGLGLSDSEDIAGSPSALSPEHRNPKPDFCLSVFKDNAGVIAFDETDAVCFKVETHNHPSAIEPYGGSATGVGGVIRDILGTGLAAKPIANTDVFCVAFPDRGVQGSRARVHDEMEKPSHALDASGSPVMHSRPASQSAEPQTLTTLPKGVIHPKRILHQIVAGVRDYGNRMGIPTVNGAVYFDDRYLGNPLVFCGCVGLIPRDKVEKETGFGDVIVVMGGRTGRDGIHGATFSLAELTDTHADEFSHAVQIGNAITEKKVADVILQARDENLFSAVTDCGAGGLSSAVGEMAEKIGATVDLEKVPLKYAGLRYDEIWISEAQERMVLSVPGKKLDQLLSLARGEDVEATVIGTFGTEKRELILNYRDTEVGRMSMDFVHHGIPMPTRKAIVIERGTGSPPVSSNKVSDEGNASSETTKATLLALLAHPNIASKHWIIRQYDHEVQGGSVIKPLVGPLQIGPSDAAVLRPKLSSDRGVVVGCGLAPHIEDPYEMALAAIDEAVRNVVAVGADPGKIAILDNFCWPSVDDEQTMGTLVRACEACRDAALAYGIPFISGKDSLHNQFTDSETGRVIRIPSTLLISAIGVIDNVRQCVTMDLKEPGNVLYLVRPAPGQTRQSLTDLIRTHRELASAMKVTNSSGRLMIRSCHDISDGGVLVCLAEMCIASNRGAQLFDKAWNEAKPFEELVGCYIVEIDLAGLASGRFPASDIFVEIGKVQDAPVLSFPSRGGVQAEIEIADLMGAWTKTLDW